MIGLLNHEHVMAAVVMSQPSLLSIPLCAPGAIQGGHCSFSQMQVQHQSYYSPATGTVMQPHPYSCRYPTTSNKGAHNEVKDEGALPPLQTFHSDRHHHQQQYSNHQPMDEPSYFYGGSQAAPSQATSFQQSQPPATATYHHHHHHYDPYPHSSYQQPYSDHQHPSRPNVTGKQHLDPALLEEALNECMPFIEPIMSMATATTYLDQTNNGGRVTQGSSRYGEDLSVTSSSLSYLNLHHQQNQHPLPTYHHQLPSASLPQHLEAPPYLHHHHRASTSSFRHHLSSTLPHYATSDGAMSMAHSPSNDSKGSGGAARLCRVPDCNKGIRSRGLCKGHGGGRRCQTAGCKISDQGGGHCIAHGGGRRCSVKDCTRSAQARGLCKCHGGGRPCKYTGCAKNSQRSGYCMAHGKLMSSIGSTIRDTNDDNDQAGSNTRHTNSTAL